ncbi:MAG: hypothetical protein QOE72_2202, partial [Chloroflexota bacterium]|nr:hypothetical protein [Chloroflexota bacterium]
ARPMPAPAPPRRHSPAARASRSQFAPPPAEVRREERCAFLLEARTIHGEGGRLSVAGSRVMPMRGSSAPPVKPLGGSNVSNAVRCSWCLGRWPRHEERAKRASPASAGVEGGSAGIGRASARCLALDGGRRSLPPVKTGGRAAPRESQPAAEPPGISTGHRTAAPLHPLADRPSNSPCPDPGVLSPAETSSAEWSDYGTPPRSRPPGPRCGCRRGRGGRGRARPSPRPPPPG